MATMYLAMWLQEADPAGTRHLVLIFIILLTVMVAAMAVVMMYIGLKALKVIKELGVTAAEMKLKFVPLLDEVMGVTKVSRVMLEDAAPKIKTISENLLRTSETLLETSKSAQAAVHSVGGTITEANLRAQRQVARVDTMVTAALQTTQEVADTITNGIRVPAMKIAEMVAQVKGLADGLMAKVKAAAAGSRFGNRSDAN
jgi:hypothetical protein